MTKTETDLLITGRLLGKFQTRGVLAGSYRGREREGLSHAVELDADGREVAVLCRRVRLEHIADVFSSPRTLAEMPSCPICALRLSRLQSALTPDGECTKCGVMHSTGECP
jgi:hypothetical protein